MVKADEEGLQTDQACRSPAGPVRRNPGYAARSRVSKFSSRPISGGKVPVSQLSVRFQGLQVGSSAPIWAGMPPDRCVVGQVKRLQRGQVADLAWDQPVEARVGAALIDTGQAGSGWYDPGAGHFK